MRNRRLFNKWLDYEAATSDNGWPAGFSGIVAAMLVLAEVIEEKVIE
jgi:hypothetical protein